jgi:hypothetical protein
MNRTDELAGTLVLVHPDLTKDPAGRPRQIGVITGTDHSGDNAYVGFGKSGQLMYGLDALLVLKPSADIQQTLKDQGAKLNIQDHTALFRIALLQDYNPTPANIKTALNLTLQSETVRNLATQSIEEKLGIRQEHYLER